ARLQVWPNASAGTPLAMQKDLLAALVRCTMRDNSEKFSATADISYSQNSARVRLPFGPAQVRYRFTKELPTIGLSLCRSVRPSWGSGSASLSLAQGIRGKWPWRSQPPTSIASSPGRIWPACSTCPYAIVPYRRAAFVLAAAADCALNRTRLRAGSGPIVHAAVALT